MTQYPIILIPPQIERVKSAQPLPLQPFSQSPPTSPGAQPQKLNFTLIGIEAALAVPLAAIISRITPMPILLIFLVAVGAIVFQSWIQVASYPERSEKYKHQVTAFFSSIALLKATTEQHPKRSKLTKVQNTLARVGCSDRMEATTVIWYSHCDRPYQPCSCGIAALKQH